MNHIKDAYITEYSGGHSLTVVLQDVVGYVNLSCQSISLHNLSADDYKRLHKAVVDGAKAAGVSLTKECVGCTEGFEVGYRQGQWDAYEAVKKLLNATHEGLYAND